MIVVMNFWLNLLIEKKKKLGEDVTEKEKNRLFKEHNESTEVGQDDQEDCKEI